MKYECLYCQLQKSNKVYTGSEFEKDFCELHKYILKRKSRYNPLRPIDDDVDIDKEQDDIYNEIHGRT